VRCETVVSAITSNILLAMLSLMAVESGVDLVDELCFARPAFPTIFSLKIEP
jgi:hypothetical protein